VIGVQQYIQTLVWIVYGEVEWLEWLASVGFGETKDQLKLGVRRGIFWKMARDSNGICSCIVARVWSLYTAGSPSYPYFSIEYTIQWCVRRMT